MKRINSSFGDWIGIFSSGICLIHCVLMPFVVSANLLLTSQDIELLPEGHDYAFAVLSLIAAYTSTRHAKRVWLNIWIWSFAALFCISVLLASFYEAAEYFMYMASAGLVFGHCYGLKHKTSAEAPTH